MALSFDIIYKGFKENKTATMMSLLVLAVVALYIADEASDDSIKKELQKSNKDCATEKYIVQTQNERLNDKYIETFGLLKEVQAEIKVLKKFVKIPE